MTIKSLLSEKWGKWLLALVIGMLAMLAPSVGFADGFTLKAPSGNSWDIYVYGNARVVQDLFTAIKLMVDPDAGQTFFLSMMYLIAIIGFFVLAVAAGFDPGKNFMRMFTYVLVVWAVVFTTTKLSANVTIIDKLNPPVNAVTVVTGVPAIVAVPASLVGQVGEYFSASIETYFSVPGFELSKVGQFNLFSTMMKDATTYRIKDPGLKRSLDSYITDCVIPGLARNAIKGKGQKFSYAGGIWDLGPKTPEEITLTGLDALMESTNLLDVYGTANSVSLFTKYYPTAARVKDGSWATALSLSAADTEALGDSNMGPDFGIMTTCDKSYSTIKTDIETHAATLLSASAEQFGAQSGSVAYATLFNDMLAGASSNQSADSFIRQKSLLSARSGNFRAAAAQTGNNEIIQTLAIEQAEQQQKSMMSSAFEVFNNMMGYMYTVLQAFLYGMAPIVILAMLVPGLGKNILVNYLQVLIWLALWSPLLGIVNYIITLFAQYDLSKAFWLAGGGLNTRNEYVISEKANNMILAGQFLGTLVPMVSWGIIKGAMAFTEFINHGIGSQFASQAGATAATGNYSLNNASADNLSMNKFSTQMSSAVGFTPVQAGIGAGGAFVKSDIGGSGVMANNSAMNISKSYQSTASNAKELSTVAESALSRAKSMGLDESTVLSLARNKQFGEASDMIANEMTSYMKSQGYSDSYIKSVGKDQQAAAALAASWKKTQDSAFEAGFKIDSSGTLIGKIGEATTGGSVYAGGKMSTGSQAAKMAEFKKNLSEFQSLALQQQKQLQASDSQGGGTGHTVSSKVSHDRSRNESQSWKQSNGDGVSAALKKATAAKESATLAESASRSMNITEATDVSQAMAAMNALEQRKFMTLDDWSKGTANLRAAADKLAGTAVAAGVAGKDELPAGDLKLNDPKLAAAKRSAIAAGGEAAGAQVTAPDGTVVAPGTARQTIDKQHKGAKASQDKKEGEVRKEMDTARASIGGVTNAATTQTNDPSLVLGPNYESEHNRFQDLSKPPAGPVPQIPTGPSPATPAPETRPAGPAPGRGGLIPKPIRPKEK